MIGVTGFLAGAKLFRWDAQQHFARQSGKAWLLPVFAAWIAVGIAAEARERVVIPDTSEPEPAAVAAPAEPLPAWAHLTEKDWAALDYDLPPDVGVVAPMAPPDMEPDEWVREQLNNVRIMLPYWVPSKGPDAVTRVRYALYVAAVPDAAQVPTEPYVPGLVLNYLELTYPKEDLIKMLTWIAQHPDEGSAILNTSDLGLKAATRDPMLVKERAYFYAVKFVAKLTNRTY